MATTKNKAIADTASVGRPSVATEENIAKAWEYVDGAWSTQLLPGGFRQVYPMVQTMAKYIGISKDSIYVNGEFSDVLKQLKDLQEALLVNNGLAGLTNPLLTKMTLSAKHGYVEKTATEADNRNVNLDVTELSDEDLDAKLAKLKSV